MRKFLALLVGALLAVPVTFAQTTSTDRLDGITTSVAVKAPVKAVTTANITLEGEQTIDGTAVVDGDRVLVKDQTDATENGIYNVSTSEWQRAADFDGARDVVSGTIVLRQGNGVFQVTTADPITIGTSSIAFAQRVLETTDSISVTDYGLVANSEAVAAANTTALQALISPAATGGTFTLAGQVKFPNPGGTDTYYFAPEFIEIRDGIAIDCQGATLDFSGSFDAANNLYGFFTFIRDVTVENCNIVIDYDGSAGTNNGAAFRIGSRNGYPFGGDSDGIEDEDLSVPMGNIVVRNNRITTNNPENVGTALLLGGLENVLIEGNVFDGSDAAPKCIYYEFGFWHFSATAADVKSSHARNLALRNNVCINHNDASATAIAVSIVGAISASVDGLWIDEAFSGLVVRSGEALFYNMGDPYDGAEPYFTGRNLTALNIASSGFVCQGAEAASLGYLATVISDIVDASEESAAQTDLLSCSLDGFSIEAAGFGVRCSAPLVLSNGSLHGTASSGQLELAGDCTRFDVDNVDIINSGNVGVRGTDASALWAATRPKRGTIRNSLVASNTGAGISLAHADGVLVESTRFGHTLLLDGVAEDSQTAGLNLTSTALNVTCRACYGAALASGSMFTNAAGAGWKFAKLENIGGPVQTISGQWLIDGYGLDDNVGDADKTLTVGNTLPTQRWATTLTANRTVTCNETGARVGDQFEAIRIGLGAFTLDVCGLKTIASGTAAFVRVVFEDDDNDGTGDWRLAAYGAL